MKLNQLKIRYFFLLITLVYIATACKAQQTVESSQSASGIPEWVENPGRVYSEARYLMAVGSGYSFEDARSRAFGNLAQIFRSQIDGTQELISEFTETQENNEAFSSSETTRLLNNISIGANEELLNTEVLASELGNDARYYVLVGMNRNESLELYRSEISNNSVRIESMVSGLERETSAFKKLNTSRTATVLAKVNDNLARQLEIISPGGFNREVTTQQVLDVDKIYATIQSETFVSIDADNQALQAAVTQTLQELGFSISISGASSLNVIVEYNAQEANLNRDDAEFVNWSLTISISEPGVNRNYQTFTARGRDGALSIEDAYLRAEFSASKEIESDFAQFLNEQLSSQN